MRTTVRVTIAALAALAAQLPAFTTAQAASTWHAPASPVHASQESTLHFDWRWDEISYAGRLIFAPTDNPSDPIWYGTDRPGRFETVTSIDSNATLNFAKWYAHHPTYVRVSAPFPAGAWYYRLCTKTIYSEDDKCVLEPEIRQLLVVASAPPAPSPSPPVSDPAEATITAAEAKRYVRAALRGRYAKTYTRSRHRVSACRRVTRARFRCRTGWTYRGFRYRGTVSIGLVAERPSARIRIRKQRVASRT